MSRRVALQEIRALTFYKDTDTLARRGRPIPQLTCVGKPSKLNQPDVVSCTSLGGSGTDVDWKVRRQRLSPSSFSPLIHLRHLTRNSVSLGYLIPKLLLLQFIMVR